MADSENREPITEWINATEKFRRLVKSVPDREVPGAPRLLNVADRTEQRVLLSGIHYIVSSVETTADKIPVRLLIRTSTVLCIIIHPQDPMKWRHSA